MGKVPVTAHPLYQCLAPTKAKGSANLGWPDPRRRPLKLGSANPTMTDAEFERLNSPLGITSSGDAPGRPMAGYDVRQAVLLSCSGDPHVLNLAITSDPYLNAGT